MADTFSRSDISVSKILAPPYSAVLGDSSDNYGYRATFEAYSAIGDTEEEAIDNLVDKLIDKGYEEE